ncbi:PP2C family protein-serine/threonine phosphatase [Streptomyces sp. V1I6]|uniref:PP2C family protein-serine/threonine phosphatase n=1 Tax=Streptomyces sp. V1I6 TaxID=3042273 RepID=UPI002789BDB8|nr:PP2C family protein-serine/threonine phosphatase [Streptomyces sp. V1I6]MDQ0847007.1 serine phosphatase RsbU (regulator of sigma subunit) [Streptomyces sp. V1I6]
MHEQMRDLSTVQDDLSWKADAGYILGRLLPFLVIALSVAADALTSDREPFDRVLFAAPALAAVTWGSRVTAGVGLLSMVASAGLAELRAEDLPGVLINETVLLAVTVAAAWSSRLRQTREVELRQVYSVAEAAQTALQRPMPSHLGSVDLHLLYEASAAGAHVGGDFYKALEVRGAVRIMLGDVQGKGLGALETASILLGSFRESAYTAPDLPAVAERLEFSMARYAERTQDSDVAGRFATVLLAEIPDDEPVVRLVSCGHPAPLIQHQDVLTTADLPSPSLPVNLSGLGLGNGDHDVQELPFEEGDRLLMFTDGVSETRDHTGAFYPLEERMRAWIREPADRMTTLLREDLVRYSGHGFDDDTAAVLVVRR